MLFRTLLIESDERVVGALASMLINDFDADVVNSLSFEEAKTIINSARQIDLICIRNNIGEEKTAQLVIGHLFDNNRSIPTIVFGECEAAGDRYIGLPSEFRIEEFQRLIIKTLNLTKEQLRNIKMPEYIAIPIKSFNLISAPCCDVFIRLKKKDEDQYIKRLLAGDVFDKDVISRYEAQGATELYIKKEYKEAFFALLLQKTKSGPSHANPSLGQSQQVFELSKEFLIKLGVNQETMLLAEQSIKEMATQVQKNKKLGPMLKELLSRPGSYFFKMSHLLCLFSANTLPHVEIGKGNQFETSMEKMAFAAFFHDLYLKDDSWGQVRNKLQLHQGQFDDKTRDIILNHAHLMAANLSQQQHIPSGVDAIIRQHHGVANGMGFQEIPNASIGPHSIFFYVLETFCHRLINLDTKKEGIKEIFLDLGSIFTIPSYRKILDAIRAGLTKI